MSTVLTKKYTKLILIRPPYGKICNWENFPYPLLNGTQKENDLDVCKTQRYAHLNNSSNFVLMFYLYCVLFTKQAYLNTIVNVLNPLLITCIFVDVYIFVSFNQNA